MPRFCESPSYGELDSVVFSAGRAVGAAACVPKLSGAIHLLLRFMLFSDVGEDNSGPEPPSRFNNRSAPTGKKAQISILRILLQKNRGVFFTSYSLAWNLKQVAESCNQVNYVLGFGNMYNQILISALIARMFIIHGCLAQGYTLFISIGQRLRNAVDAVPACCAVRGEGEK